MKLKLTKTKSALIALPLLALTVLAGGVAQAATDTSIATTSSTSDIHSTRSPRIALTDAQKETMKQVRALHEAGKTAEAEALAKSSGLPQRPADGGKGSMGKGRGHNDNNLTAEQKTAMEAKRAATEAAITANDYAAFAKLVAGSPFEGKVTEANFAKLVQAQALHKAGDHDGARAIMESLGLKGGHGARGLDRTAGVKANMTSTTQK